MGYDVKKLGEKLKAKGVPVLENAAEETALQAYAAVKEWLQEEAALSENKIDDVVVTFFGQVDAVVLPLIDKIDKQEG
jgi:hypothetical protein